LIHHCLCLHALAIVKYPHDADTIVNTIPTGIKTSAAYALITKLRIIKITPPNTARIPVVDLVNTIEIIPPIIDRPAVQFNTPNALVGVSGVGGLGVHDPEPNELVVCPHEHPAIQNRKARETSIEMILAGLPTIQPPYEKRRY
jgi:hypothetical protein